MESGFRCQPSAGCLPPGWSDRVFVGFGTFGISKRKARTGRNPQTGAMIKINAKKVVRFKAGKALDSSVNKSK